MNHNIFKNQKGVALIVTFFILTIVLAIVLNVSILLFNEIKIIRNVGNSVVAFYSADSGIEKVLYYDRQQKPPNTGRGICNICNLCLSNGDCLQNECSITGTGCDICSSCNITFKSEVSPGKTYSEDITVYQQCKISSGTISSYGYYGKVSRAIRIDSTLKVDGFPPEIANPGCTTQGQGSSGFRVEAVVSDQDGEDGEEIEVIAIINGVGNETETQCEDANSNGLFINGNCIYRELTLIESDGVYGKGWNFNIDGIQYTVTIMATDEDGNCIEVPACVITT